ncbi:MAG TPA: carboxypeptidase regulatory-like domain-containing protein [Thermoplasmatales archaeon]|nr:carboxypeptidase regulatory-like domain-containing protein [Thermoplasmatales archaeon]
MGKTKSVILITSLIVIAVFAVSQADARTDNFNQFLTKKTVKCQTVTLTVAVYRHRFIYVERPEPIAGATVSVTSDVHSASGVTDENGLCHLQVLPGVFYTLKVHKSGYRSFSMGLNIKCDTLVTIVLKKSLQNAEESGNHLMRPSKTHGLQLKKTFPVHSSSKSFSCFFSPIYSSLRGVI